MIKISGKRIGRPDFSTDVSISMIPMIIRHQIRLFAAGKYVLELTFNESGIAEGISCFTAEKYDRGKTHGYYYLSTTIGTYTYYTIEIGEVDLDKLIEREYFGYPWTKEDILKPFGIASGYGNVKIKKNIYSPFIIHFEPDEPTSRYLPLYLNRLLGVWFTIYGTPNTTITLEVNVTLTGMSSGYPWWI